MNIKYPLLIPVIGHGATDIIDFPFETLAYNLFSALLVYNCNLLFRQSLLIGFSIFHNVQDIPNEILYKSKIINLKKIKYPFVGLVHGLWIKFPIIAKLHFLTFHSPLHYLRIILMRSNVKLKLLTGFSVSLASMYFLNKDYDLIMEKKMGKLWWIFPILPHIILTHKTNQHFINNVKKHRSGVAMNKYIGSYVTSI